MKLPPGEGGHDGNSYLNSVECYDPKSDQWSSEVAPTGCCRTSVGVTVLGNCVYAVGGQDGLACLSLVERSASLSIQNTLRLVFFHSRYDPTTNKWQQVSSMKTPRLGVGVASLGGYLYAVGGSDGESPLASAER